MCVQDSTSGRFQLLSQGTGEILLDACVDYWNGSDLCQLTMSDRYFIIDAICCFCLNLLSILN